MRWIIAILLATSPACAQSVSEKTGINQMLDRAPTGSDVLLELHQFDLFQQATTDSSDKRGDDAIKKLAVSQSDAAEKRDKQLASFKRRRVSTYLFPTNRIPTEAIALPVSMVRSVKNISRISTQPNRPSSRPPFPC